MPTVTWDLVNVNFETYLTPNLIRTHIHLCVQWQQNGGQRVPQQKVPANINNTPQITALEACFYINLTPQIAVSKSCIGTHCTHTHTRHLLYLHCMLRSHVVAAVHVVCVVALVRVAAAVDVVHVVAVVCVVAVVRGVAV